MPLLDHFRPPWSPRKPWDGVLNAWAACIARRLNADILPSEYAALPTLQKDTPPVAEAANGTQAPLVIRIAPASVRSTAVHVVRDFGGPQLRAVIEIVSPSNKDRPASRRAFATKCAGYLRRGVSVVIADVVTDRDADLHAEVVAALEPAVAAPWASESGLYAVAYRAATGTGAPEVQVWAHALAVGQASPELPLWLEPDLCVPLRLEEAYAATLQSLRFRP